MLLRVRHGDLELVVPGEEELVRRYRGRRLSPSDLVWHPTARRWVRLDAFLFIDGRPSGDPSPALRAFRRASTRAPGDSTR